MAQQYTNIRLVLDKVMRHPLMRDLTLETAVDYCVDFMRLVGVPEMFEEKDAVIKIDDYRGKLPCDYYDVIQVRSCKSTGVQNKIAYRYATDSFHLSKSHDGDTDRTYKIQNNMIFTSRKDEDVEMAYRAIAVDEEGYPKIIDNADFIRALQMYIKKEWFTTLNDLGRLSQQAYQQCLQEYAWAVGCCESEFQRMTIDKAESFFASFRTLLMRPYEHQHGFKNDGIQERLKAR